MRIHSSLYRVPCCIIVLLLFVFSVGCGEDLETIAVEGTWVIEGTWGEKWVITAESITYLSVSEVATTNYAADIVRFSNTRVNGGETELVSGGTTQGLGHAVIRFTEVANAGWGEIGKYQIFRWGTSQDNSAARDFSQGYKNAGDHANEVFDSAAEAEAGATIAGGHFSFASQGAVRE